jgi:diguanylate cyclase (GGDEF)-like protein
MGSRTKSGTPPRRSSEPGPKPARGGGGTARSRRSKAKDPALVVQQSPTIAGPDPTPTLPIAKRKASAVIPDPRTTVESEPLPIATNPSDPEAPSLDDLDDLDETAFSANPGGESESHVAGDTPARLVVISHPDSAMLGRSYDIVDGSELTIGRSAQADISLSGLPAISRGHARISRQSADVIIQDLGSRNGTFLRGEKLNGPTTLKHGDQITIESVHIRFISGSDSEQAYHEALYDMVMHDDLTQTYNRRKYENEVERDFARAIRHKRELSLVLIDVDHFKAINDRYGHPCGDAVLQQIAGLITRQLRREELLARVGGDEFLVLCPEVGAAGVSILAERLRAAIDSHPFRRGDLTLHVTCTFGVAELTPDIHNPAELYAAADAHLYAAKSAGRNRVG